MCPHINSVNRGMPVRYFKQNLANPNSPKICLRPVTALNAHNFGERAIDKRTAFEKFCL